MSTILVVDDEPGVRITLSRSLEADGYQVRQAADADEALRAMSVEAAAVVFCDVRMPGHDGIWLVRQLREQFPTTAIILATALDAMDPAVSLQPGVVDYLVKPFEKKAVRRALSRAIEWRRAAQATGRHDQGCADWDRLPE